ncbi:MAG: T9SS type A sorting domain-containing protein [Bacteroidota bacterium]
MNKNYFLLIALLISSLSFGQIWSEDFESYADGTGVEGSSGGVVVNVGDYPAGVSQWTIDASNASLTAASDWAKTVSGLFEFRDLDGDTIWESELINISGATSAVSFSLEASPQGGLESADYFDVYYSVDGGAFTLIADWNGLGDATHTILGEKNGTDWTTTEVISQSGLMGNTLQIRVVAINNAGSEYFRFDNVTVFEGAAAPSLSVTAPTNNEVFAPGTSSVDVGFITQNIDLSMLGNYVNVTVNMGTTDVDVTSPYAIPTMDGGMYNVTVELYESNAVVDTKMVSFSVENIAQVNNLTELRAGTIGEFYEVTGEVVISYVVTDNGRNQKYIQDGGAGILIDDPSTILSTPFNAGDGMIGLQGRLSEFNGVLQFVPIANLPGASSTGNAIMPLFVTATELATNGEAYESRLIRLLNVEFTDMGMFADGVNYNVTTAGGTAMTVCRVQFGDEDLIGTMIPAVPVDITGLAGEFGSTYQVLPRFASDIDTTLSNGEFDTTSFSMYPNPANGDTVTITSPSNNTKEVQVYSILGKQVLNTTITNTLNVADLQTGIYVVKITENGKSATKKLVIR